MLILAYTLAVVALVFLVVWILDKITIEYLVRYQEWPRHIAKPFVKNSGNIRKHLHLKVNLKEMKPLVQLIDHWFQVNGHGTEYSKEFPAICVLNTILVMRSLSELGKKPDLNECVAIVDAVCSDRVNELVEVVIHA